MSVATTSAAPRRSSSKARKPSYVPTSRHRFPRTSGQGRRSTTERRSNQPGVTTPGSSSSVWYQSGTSSIAVRAPPSVISGVLIPGWASTVPAAACVRSGFDAPPRAGLPCGRTVQRGEGNIHGGESAVAGVAAPAGPSVLARAAIAVRGRLGMESAVFALLALWSVLPFAVFFLSFHDGGVSLDRGNGVFNGSAGLQVGDHMQYLGWIRDAGEHVLFSNRYDVAHDPHLFLHPVFLLAGL